MDKEGKNSKKTNYIKITTETFTCVNINVMEVLCHWKIVILYKKIQRTTMMKGISDKTENLYCMSFSIKWTGSIK